MTVKWKMKVVMPVTIVRHVTPVGVKRGVAIDFPIFFDVNGDFLERLILQTSENAGIVDKKQQPEIVRTKCIFS